MDYQLTTNILLAIIGFIALAVMLRWDMTMLQQHDYSNKQFMQWLHTTDESYSTKRIVPMATLVICASQYARNNWMVVAVLVITILILVIALIIIKPKKPFKLNSRAIVSIVVVLAVAATCSISLATSKFTLEAGMLMLLLTAFSYVPLLGVNWIANLLTRNNRNQQNTQSTNEEI